MKIDHRIFFYFFCWLCIFLPRDLARANDAQNSLLSQISEAASLYEKNKTEEAFAIYQKIISEFSSDNLNQSNLAPIYYNAGSIALKSKQLGWAYLYLARSKISNPFDEETQQNWLLLTNTLKQSPSISYASFQLSSWVSNIAYTQADLFFTIALVGLLSIATALMSKGGKKFLIFILSCLVGVCLFIACYNNNFLKSTAIVIKDSVIIRSGPNDSFPEITTLNSGSSVSIIGGQNSWNKVSFYINNNGLKTIGWLPSSQAVVIQGE